MGWGILKVIVTDTRKSISKMYMLLKKARWNMVCELKQNQSVYPNIIN